MWVNGQTEISWSDDRLKRLSERDSLLGHVMAYSSLFVLPWDY